MLLVYLKKLFANKYARSSLLNTFVNVGADNSLDFH
eukprot:UN05029